MGRTHLRQRKKVREEATAKSMRETMQTRTNITEGEIGGDRFKGYKGN